MRALAAGGAAVLVQPRRQFDVEQAALQGLANPGEQGVGLAQEPVLAGQHGPQGLDGLALVHNLAGLRVDGALGSTELLGEIGARRWGPGGGV